jgi:hypothetical protein
MIEQTSAAQIGPFGYTHWSRKPVTPGAHGDLKLVPQTLADGWEGYCSCGEWRSFIGFDEIEDRDDLLLAIRERWAFHKAGV